MIDAKQAAEICGGKVRKQNNGWMCSCPSHDDPTASLKIDDKDGGGLLVKCFAGCTQSEVIDAMKTNGAWPSRGSQQPAVATKAQPAKKKSTKKKTAEKKVRSKIVAEYDYVDETGELLFQCVRKEPKDFRQRRPNPDGGWIWDLKDIKLVPYCLPEVIAGVASKRYIFIVEGEKDVISLRDGLDSPVIATCSPMGAGKWKSEFNQYFTDAVVVIIPDNDSPGRKHADDIFHHLRSYCSAVRIMELPNVPPGGDVSDWIDMGGTYRHLNVLVQETFKEAPQTFTDDEPVPAPAPHEPMRSTKPNLGLVDHTGAVRKPEDLPDEKPELATTTLAALWDHLGLILNRYGRPIPNLDNALRIVEGFAPLQFHPDGVDISRGRVVYDVFFDRVRTNWGTKDNDTWVDWTDADTRRMVLLMQRQVGVRQIGTTIVHDAVLTAAFTRQTNEPKEWMQSLTWDGKRRLRDLVPVGFGAKRNEYTEAVGRCWIMGMAKRIFVPGAQVDNMPVFEGAQGGFKSSACSVIGGKWYVECHESVTSKDFYQVMTGAMLVEMSELHAFRRTDVERIKGIITCRVDRYRRSYGKLAEDHPRSSVFSGTANNDDWNADDTGARRFWPVTTGFVDTVWIADNRDQLFAEAVERVLAGESHWDVPEGLAKIEQDARRKPDEWEDVIEYYLLNEPNNHINGDQTWYARDEPLIEFNIGDFMANALQLPKKNWSRGDQMRIGGALKHMDWHRARVAGRRTYVSPAHPSHPKYGIENDEDED